MKDMTDTARQNSLIAEEQRQIAHMYSQIGKLYCDTVEPDEETPIGKLAYAVRASQERIEKYNEEIRLIKGARRCPSCSAEIPLSSTFCGICGGKTEVAEGAPPPPPGSPSNACKGCGAELVPGAAFCTSCGQGV
jgi:hypothetical protein